MGLFGDIAQAGIGIAQAIGGYKERKRQRRDQRRAENTINDMIKNAPKLGENKYINDNLSFARNQFSGKSMLGQSMENNANRAFSNNVAQINRFSTSSGDALAALSGASQAYAGNLSDASVAAAQEKNQQAANRMAATREAADYETMRWDMNERMSWLQGLQFQREKYGLASNMAMMANQSMSNGMNNAALGLASAGESAIDMWAKPNSFLSKFGNNS